MFLSNVEWFWQEEVSSAVTVFFEGGRLLGLGWVRGNMIFFSTSLILQKIVLANVV